MKDLAKIKVAIVHDWLIGGGAELVVEQLHLMFPDAPIYTSYCTDQWRQRLDDKVVTGVLQHWPFSGLRKFIPPLRIWWFTRLKLDNYDLVISSSGAEAKGINTGPNTLHVNYCHAPTHYYWSRYEEYLKRPGFGWFDSLARVGLKLLVGPLRRWDYRAAQHPQVMIANSNFIKAEIEKYYGREATVIHPPVDTDRFRVVNRQSSIVNRRKGFVIAGRQTPYKRVDLAVEACTKLNLPLTVISNGPDHERLKSLAGPSVIFSSNTSDEDMVTYFQSAQAFIFPGIDDFGIVAVEALAAGTPVIAYRAGGALDYVMEGKTGRFFNKQTVDSLAKVLKNFKKPSFSPTAIAGSTEQFSPSQFRTRFTNLLNDLLKKDDK